MTRKSLIYKYFFVLFSIIPISIILGPSVSLANIVIIIFSFLAYVTYINEWSWLKDSKVRLLFILYIYLIFNSFIALDFSNSFYRNFGFIRFIILFSAFNYFFLKFENFNKILIIWFIILALVFFDIYYERINGTNILWYGNSDRIFSFFKDEPIVGGYAGCLYLIIIGFFFQSYSKTSNKIRLAIFLLSIYFLVSILLTGERSNSIRAIIGFFIFYSLINNFSFKEKVISGVITITILSFIFINSDFLKMRYVGQFLKFFESKELLVRYYEKGIYSTLYRSGVEVFRRNLYFGVGNKNYRVETCSEDRHQDEYNCNTHPHQIYFELLSEHGMVGTLIILSIFFKLIFDLLKKIVITKNRIQLGSFIYILLVFLPLLPSGAFFSDYSLTIFFINFSLLFCTNKKSNLFYKN